MFKHILLPTDRSKFSERSLDMGSGVAKAHGACIAILTASVPFHILTNEAMSLSGTKEIYAVDTEKRAGATLKFGLNRARS